MLYQFKHKLLAIVMLIGIQFNLERLQTTLVYGRGTVKQRISRRKHKRSSSSGGGGGGGGGGSRSSSSSSSSSSSNSSSSIYIRQLLIPRRYDDRLM
jgi:hypothetical protein